MSYKTIGGVRVVRRIGVVDNAQRVRSAQSCAVSEVVEQSTSLSLDDPRDRQVLVKRIRYALGLDS